MAYAPAVLALLRRVSLAVATLLVVVVAGWAGVVSAASAELDDPDTVEMADEGDDAVRVPGGGPPSMQEEDDEVDSHLPAALGWLEAPLRLVRWPAPIAHLAPHTGRGDRPPHAGPLERPPHA
jgi:hypothetical protein